jgi:hypothetical protein
MMLFVFLSYIYGSASLLLQYSIFCMVDDEGYSMCGASMRFTFFYSSISLTARWLLFGAADLAHLWGCDSERQHHLQSGAIYFHLVSLYYSLLFSDR